MSRKPRLKDQIDALLRGPAPAEQGDPDAFDGQHDAMALGTLSDDDVAAQPEGADAAPRARAGETSNCPWSTRGASCRAERL